MKAITNIAIIIVGIEIRIPYFIKVKKENSTSFFFRIDIHIIPAKAPIGVRKAPMLDPAITENVNFIILGEEAKHEIILLKKTHIGILFIILEQINDNKP